MSGLELILSAALCLSCTPNGEKGDMALLPPNLIRLDADGNVLPVPPLVGDSGPTGSAELDASELDAVLAESQQQKQWRLRELRQWLNGRHLRIATLEDYPLSYTTMLDNSTRQGLGVSFEIIDFLQEKFNFTYEVVVPSQNIIGSKNDFADSLVALLNDTGSVDLAAAFIPLLTDPREFMAYSTTTLDEGEWIMVMQRPLESASGSGLLAPFEFWVWILILVSLLAVGPIIYMLIILRNKLTGDGEQKPYSLGHCAWFVYGALMKQGSILSPVADSTRLLFATWWIFITILTSFYTANLTAFLTLSKFTLPFNTVNDILAKNKYFVTSRGGGVEYSIRNTNESLSMLSRMISNNRAQFSTVVNDSEILERYVERDGFVFVRDRPAINHVLYRDYRYRKTISMHNEKIHCPFAMAKMPFLKKKRAFAYPLGTNLSDLFDPELLNLVESGIVKYLSGQSLPNAEICPQDLGGTERQLRNSDLMMTYYIMFAGFATSIVVFSTELAFRFLNGRQDMGKWESHGVGRTPNGLLLEPSRWANRNTTDRAGASYSNVTPPPPYQSIFSNAVDVFAKRGPSVGHQPQAFMGFDGQVAGGVRRIINGRDYLVVRTPNGQSQLVPMRAPSAALFQYTYTD